MIIPHKNTFVETENGLKIMDEQTSKNRLKLSLLETNHYIKSKIKQGHMLLVFRNKSSKEIDNNKFYLELS